MRTGRLLPCVFGIAACVPIGETRRDERPSAGDSAESAAVPGDIAISPHNLIANATFEDGTSLPWTSSFTSPANGEVGVVDGALCLRIDNRGYNNWDAQVRHREMVIQSGHRYTISFRAFATQPTNIRPKVGMQGPPYAEYWFDEIKIDETPRRFTGKFRKSSGDDPGAEFAFHMGGRLADGTHTPLTICIDNVRLEDQQFNRPAKAKTDNTVNILVNQVGYYPNLAKIATLKSAATQQLDWKLLGGDGREAAYGKTQPAGLDTPSGERVHIIDFSAFKGTGRGFVLTVGADRSQPFEIGNDLYHKMKYDALAYYYHNRSGIDITMPYAGGAQWARPAGHLSDKSVPCVQGSGCAYRLDVSGGWYDAGDHGKYVVNGGISVWTLLNLYERAQLIGKSTKAFADGTLNIPEQHNGVADLLDEVRWELEFLLKMQVPDGQPKAGMVHHKVHDKEWTALGLAPHEDPMPRFLYPVSTAATLNLAAVAAQAGRIWKTIDPAFAARCVTAAEKAWAAAAHNPAIFAKPGGVGGGPYEDNHVEDEFYWAAAELFITTKRPEYRQYLTSSPSFLKVPVHLGQGEGEGIPSSMTWQEVAALGTISLSIVPGALSASEQKTARNAVISAADTYMAILKQRGFRVPIDWGKNNKSPWGSNSFLLNNLVVLGLAGDFTDGRKYLNAVVAGMDYILGRNAMDQSYVTGWGSRPLVNPHHRFWAYQSNNKFPHAPPGAVSGGPNSGLQDPYVKAANMFDCAPDKCFADNIESWATNEITINWNAPLAWVLFYLDERGPAARASK
jgi:endoglucanase